MSSYTCINFSRPSGHGKDADRKGDGRRGQRALHLRVGLRVPGNVRGRGASQGQGHVPDGEEARAMVREEYHYMVYSVQ